MNNKSVDELLANIFREEKKIPLRDLFEGKLKQFGISYNQACKALKMDKKSIDPILDNKSKQVNAVNLLKLGEFLGLDVEDTIQYFLENNTSEAAKELNRAKKAKFIYDNFDLKELKKIGFISSYDLDEVAERIRSFFNLPDIFDYIDESMVRQVAFSRSKVSSDDKMRNFWIKTAVAQFEAIDNPNDFDRDRFKQLVSRIRPYSRDVENGFFQVCQALYHAGVTVIYQSMLPKTQVRGGTFIINNKPCIVITDLYKRYGTLWFTLLHELFHALFHLEDIKARGFHLSGDIDLWLDNEKDADDFARQYFVSDEKMQFIVPTINNQYMVSKYAEEWNIHPCIIYNFYAYDNNDWVRFQRYDPGLKSSVQKINAISFDKKSVNEIVLEIKHNLELI